MIDDPASMEWALLGLLNHLFLRTAPKQVLRESCLKTGLVPWCTDDMI